MAKAFSKQPILPSLLDRLTDDDYLNRNIQAHQHRIDTLERKLSALDRKNKAEHEGILTLSPEEVEQKQTWLHQLQEQREQVKFLYGNSGSLKKVKDCVKRDLTWLLNTQNLCMSEDLEKSHPHVSCSVLNYGLPDLTGRTASSVNVPELERYIKHAILNYEPRLIRNTLKVHLLSEESMFDHNALVFQISADLWMDPVPLHLQLKTQIDLENGHVNVKED